MVTVSSFVRGLLSKLPNFTFHALQRHSSVHRLLSHTTTTTDDSGRSGGGGGSGSSSQKEC
jgi:hypothetical protein